jgi:hypothetical protein
MGLYVDLAIEVVSIGTGAWSFVTNAWAGNLAAAGVDAAGVVIDVGLAIVPGAPGGTGLALKAGREAAERVAREAAERAAREAAEQAARAAREAAEKAAKTGGSCAVPKIAAPRSHNELAQDFIRNPNEWERVGTQVGRTPAGKHKGGTNIESQWRNKRTGEQVSIHEAFNKAGKSIHPENASPNTPGGGSIRPRHRAKELE